MTEQYQITTLEEMPKALSFIIKQMDGIQKELNILRTKQQMPPQDRWMSIEDLMEYHPSHPKKQTVYEWVSKNLIPYHKQANKKELIFLQSEIDNYLKGGYQKTEAELEMEASQFILSKKNKGL